MEDNIHDKNQQYNLFLNWIKIQNEQKDDKKSIPDRTNVKFAKWVYPVNGQTGA